MKEDTLGEQGILTENYGTPLGNTISVGYS